MIYYSYYLIFFLNLRWANTIPGMKSELWEAPERKSKGHSWILNLDLRFAIQYALTWNSEQIISLGMLLLLLFQHFEGGAFFSALSITGECSFFNGNLFMSLNNEQFIIINYIMRNVQKIKWCFSKFITFFRVKRISWM